MKTLQPIFRLILIACAVATIPCFCDAAVIDFENFALPGTVDNISPTSPYTEDGFTITPTNASSAVFDSSANSTLIGSNTDWFGFSESNNPSLTFTASTGRFNLDRLLIGPSTIASNSAIDMTITGNLFGGGTVSRTFNGLSTATIGVLNWTNLSSVVFLSSDDAGLDDIVVSSIPEPSTLALAALGLMGFFRTRRRQV